MTAGQAALAEAARLETARIYSQLSTEHRESCPQQALRSDVALVDLEAARQRRKKGAA